MNKMNYDKYLNKKVKDIPPSGIRKFFDIVAERKDAISLGVGEPDFDTQWVCRDAAIKSIQKGYTQYTSNAGLLKLRELIAKYYSERYSVDYDPKTDIIVTVGASEGIDLSLRAIVCPGDDILVPAPSYVSYSPCVTLAGGNAVSVECYQKDDFRVTVESLEKAITPNTKALLLPYPNNPTGAILEEKELIKIAKFVIENDLLVISDEIYSELTYTQKGHISIASIEGMKERCIVLNGFSKAFAMTGWRLGYLLAPSEICKTIYKIHQYAIMCAPTPSQYAGVAGLESGFKDNFAEIAKMRDQYDMRRRFLVKSLNDMGLECFEPKGAFYVFPCVKSLNMTGDEFANLLFQEENLAVVPGSAFGDSGKYYIRISYAYSIKKIEEALIRIKAFVEKHRV